MTSIDNANSKSLEQLAPELANLETPGDKGSLQTSLVDAIEFAENQEPRCPCVLLLDTSGSMAGKPIAALNEGLKAFKTDILEDPVAPKRVEVAVVAFDTTVRLVQDFVTPDRFDPPVLTAQGVTHMGAAINTALDLVQARKERYREAGIPYYRPWVMMITDGDPQGELFTFVEDASKRVRREVNRDRLVFFTVAAPGADVTQIMRMGFPKPVKLDGLKFSELFVWLSRSMQAVTSDAPGGKFSFLPTRWAKK